MEVHTFAHLYLFISLPFLWPFYKSAQAKCVLNISVGRHDNCYMQQAEFRPLEVKWM